MRFSPHPLLLLPAASLLLVAGAAAAVQQEVEARAHATDAWVSVDKTGLPSTVTPVVTASDGAPATLSAIPPELTATLLTRTAYGELTTSAGSAPALPTATNRAGAGAFLLCTDPAPAHAPFCAPSGGNATMYPGTTYYLTWDPSAITNGTKVKVIGTYLNATTGAAGDQAFSSDPVRKSWGYFAWTPAGSMLKQGTGKAVNISLALAVLSAAADDDDEAVAQTYAGPTVLVAKAPAYRQRAPALPNGAALYIGLPVVLGFCLLMVCGLCAWNRKARQIGLGNIMSRGRHGYGVAKSRARRMTMRGAGKKQKQQAVHIRLMDQVPEEDMYRDEPRGGGGRNNKTEEQLGFHLDESPDWRGPQGHARRDSDALGSLAGTPTSERFPRQQPGKGGNVFREEMERQRQQDRY